MFICELFKYNDSVVPYHPERNRDNLEEADSEWHNDEGQWYDGHSMFHSPDQDPYTGPQSDADEWYNGDDQWHGETNEDMAVANLITDDEEPVSIEHILTARGLIRRAIDNKLANKHEYFEFLKYLRDKYGKDYSTAVHQKAVKLST